MTSIALEFAQRICALQWHELDDNACSRAKTAIADALGCTLAGWPEPCTQTAARVFAQFPVPGPCTVAGTTSRCGPLEAAFINGTACHALDFDDCNNTVGGHPTAPILFATLALGEVLKASGRDIIAAYVAGFETMAKLARAVHFHHYQKGWHPTATLGVFGATAASCHLLGLDVEKTAQALSHSASLAAGVKANFGTMTKPLHVGYANRNGLFSAQLAAAGATAGNAAFEHPQGFFEVFNGAGTYDPTRCFDTWAAPLDLVSPGVALKAYPCCGSTHPAIDAALRLREKHDIKPERIVAIRSTTHQRRLAHTDRPNPVDGLDAKFSVQYVIARALTSGHVGLSHFCGSAHRAPEVRALMSKIEVQPHHDDNHFCAYLDVETEDGKQYSQFIPTPLGRDDSNPLPMQTLRSKFDDCCSLSIEKPRSDALWEAIFALDSLDDIRDLTAHLSGSAEAFIQTGTDVVQRPGMAGEAAE